MFIKSLNTNKLYNVVYGLAIFTIIYNIAEGIISVYFGFEDESLSLFGFGIDSFIEVISGLGIANMIFRIKQKPECSINTFEKRALQITGFSFFGLTAGLLTAGIYNLYTGHKPETTFWGLIIALISIFVMLLLIFLKIKVGKKLNSKAILADAECTRVCIYMSVILLVSSLIFELTGFKYIDIIGAFGIAYLSVKEGFECFEKARNNGSCSCKK